MQNVRMFNVIGDKRQHATPPPGHQKDGAKGVIKKKKVVINFESKQDEQKLLPASLVRACVCLICKIECVLCIIYTFIVFAVL
jgi:hypothetical protein